MSEIKTFRVFNGEVLNMATKAFFGEASGILDLDDIRYPNFLDNNKMLGASFWTEEEIRLGDDLKQYVQLSEEERYVYNVITGYLTALDSFATKFNFVLAMVISCPAVLSCIATINYFEVLHNRSYQYLTSTMLNSAQKKEAFNSPKEIPLLVERNNLVVEKIQNMIDEISQYALNGGEVSKKLVEAIYEGILANLVLEGLFFTGGFVYFHSLARDNRMLGTNNMINLIKEDETQHNAVFGDIMKVLMLEHPELNTSERHEKAVQFIRQCVEKEKEWGSFLFKNIDTLSIKEYHDYVEYLSNVICRNAGIKEPYPENRELKAKWTITYGSKGRSEEEGAIATRADFFQTNVIDYGHEGGGGFDL
jgi:ribonucleoside-diphosphate reductase beta chain